MSVNVRSDCICTCPVSSRLVSSRLVLSCLVLSCLVLSCLVLSCLVLSCLVLPLFPCLSFPVSLSVCFLCLCLSLSLSVSVMLCVMLCVVLCCLCCVCCVLLCVWSGVGSCLCVCLKRFKTWRHWRKGTIRSGACGLWAQMVRYIWRKGGKRQTEPSHSWFPPKFHSGQLELNSFIR